MKTFSKRVLSVLLSVLLLTAALPIGTISAQADALDDAKNAFLAKVTDMYNYSYDYDTGTQTGKLYKNAMPAYLAYIDACKDGAGADEAAALATATAAMTEFTPYTANTTFTINGTDAARGKYNGSGTASEKCYSNVLYTTPRSMNIQYSELAHGFLSWSNGILVYSDDVFIYQPDAVVLYDGRTPAKIPVLFAEQENNGNYAFRYGYVLETGARLEGYWKGRNRATRNGKSTSVDIVWPENVDYSLPHIEGTDDYWDANNSGSSAGGHGSESDFYNFSNSLVFTVDNGKDYTTVTNKTEYKGIANYKKISKFEWNIDAFYENLVTGSLHHADGDTTLYTNKPVYVVNYKKLLDKMELTIAQKRDTYIKVSDSAVKQSFDEGNAVGFFGAFDTATALNPADSTKYDYSTNGVQDTVEQVAGDINEACIDLDEISSTAASISSIVSNIQKYEAMMKENPYRYYLAETYQWYLKAKECFDAYIFGQKNGDSDSEFLSYMGTVANGFDTAISNSIPYASYTESGGVKTFTANPIEGDYTPDDEEKFFENDTSKGKTAATAYKSAGALNNVLYYPTVTRSNGIRARTDTYGGSNHSYSIDGITVPFNGDGDGTNHFTVYYPSEVVLAYNGSSNPTFPVLSGIRNAHNSGGVENYSIAAYPTDSTTLLNLSSRYLGDVAGYESHDGKSDGYYPYLSSYNVVSSSKGPHAPAESSTFQIKTFSTSYTYDGTTSTTNKYWKGIYTEKDKNNLPLNWLGSWNLASSSYSGNGAMYGTPTEWWGRYYDMKADDNHGRAEVATSASAIEFKANPFSGKTAADNAAYYTADYNGPNWYHAWQEVRFTTDLNVEVLLDNGTSKIRVLNVVPAQEAKQQLLNNTPTQDILGAIFQYDKDSADVVKFLTSLDKVGSFNPNDSKYNYSATTQGTPQYSTNAGIEQACKDMAALNEEVTEALSYIDESGTSDNPQINDDKVNKPTDAESTSTKTEDLGDGWYDNLRKALLNPREADGCTDTNSKYYKDYMKALGIAQDAVAYSAMSKIKGGSGADYEASYTYTDPDSGETTKTIQQIAEDLVAAAADFDKSNTNHLYSYEDEDEDQFSDWGCSNNASHVHTTADMSVYNELDIAYHTIDPEAYKNFESVLGNIYDDENLDNGDVTFVEVKKLPTRQQPQAYVDDEIADLLTAINDVSTQGSSSQLESYDTHLYVSIDGADPVKVADYNYNYGDVTSFDATNYIPAGTTCYKWTVQQKGSDSVQTVYNRSNTLSNFVQSEADVTAYVNSATATDTALVTIYGPTKAVIEEFNASKNDSVQFDTAADGAVKVTIGGTAHTIASTTSYTVTGISAGSKYSTESFDGKSYDSLSDLLAELGTTTLVVTPIYEAATVSTKYTITAHGAYTAKSLTNFATNANAEAAAGTNAEFSGDETGVLYDQKVRISFTENSAMGELYGIAVNTAKMTGSSVPRYVPISYSNMYDFRANADMDFYPLYRQVVEKDEVKIDTFVVDDGANNGAGTKITNATDRYYLSRHLPFVIDYMDKSNIDGKFVFRVAFTANIPEDANVTITEHGWMFFASSNSGLVNAIAPGEQDLRVGKVFDDVVVDGTTYSGLTPFKQAASKTYDPASHQYSFSNKNRSSYFYLLGRAYVKYTYTFVEPNPEDPENPTSAPIEAISYGRADFYKHD